MPINAFSSFTDGLELTRKYYREAGLDSRQLGSARALIQRLR